LDIVGICGLKLPTPPNLSPETDTILWGLTLGIFLDLLKVAGKKPLSGDINVSSFSFPNAWRIVDKPTQLLFSIATSNKRKLKMWMPGAIAAVIGAVLLKQQQNHQG
jgi:hypothetical protein